MNELPIMPIRAKYADETAKGVNIDEAIEGAVGDIDAVEGRVETLETTVGDSSTGLVKKVSDLEQKTTGMSYYEGVTDFDGKVTGDEIIENMSGYSFDTPSSATGVTKTITYAGAVKNGNKLTFVISGTISRGDTYTAQQGLGAFSIPANIAAKLMPTSIAGNDFLDNQQLKVAKTHTSYVDMNAFIEKGTNKVYFYGVVTSQFEEGETYYFRYEATFLLSNNLAE